MSSVLRLLVLVSSLAACQSNKPTDGKPRASATVDAAISPMTATATLHGLSRDPLSVKPTMTRLPSNEEGTPYGARIYTHYEYDVPPIGRVEQERKDDQRWHIEVHVTGTNVFAAPGELLALDVLGPARWFRVTGGPFAGHFLVRTADGERVSSKVIVCEEMATSITPKISAECSSARSQ